MVRRYPRKITRAGKNMVHARRGPATIRRQGAKSFDKGKFKAPFGATGREQDQSGERCVRGSI